MKKTHIVLHHSATQDGDTLSYPAIRQTHIDKGWRNVGYHFIIEAFDRRGDIADAQYLSIVGRGQTTQAAGEWRQGFNKHGIHICFVGDFDKSVPPTEMLRHSAPLVRSLLEAHSIEPHDIIGHRDIVGVIKTCPGKLFDIPAYQELIEGWD